MEDALVSALPTREKDSNEFDCRRWENMMIIFYCFVKRSLIWDNFFHPRLVHSCSDFDRRHRARFSHLPVSDLLHAHRVSLKSQRPHVRLKRNS